MRPDPVRRLAAAVALAACARAATAATYLVEYTKPAAAVLAVKRAGGTVALDHREIRVLVAESSRPNFLDRLRASPAVRAAAPDRTVRVLEPLAGAAGAERVEASALAPLGSPFDAAALGLQWPIFATETDLAWATTLGDPAVRVAVLDTGYCAHHDDTAGRVDSATSAAFVAESDPACAAAAAACPTCPPWEDYAYHGTFVASAIATNNLYSAGVAPEVTLQAIKVIDCAGNANFAAAIGGLLYAVATGADVVNASFGLFYDRSDPDLGTLVGMVAKAVNYAQSRGALVVAGAGNSAVDLDRDGSLTFVPCQGGGALCVGATNALDELASYSNHGVSGPQLVAPGGDFTAPVPLGLFLGPCAPHQVALQLAGFPPCAANDLLYSFGTSFATPMVAGAAALVDSIAPGGPGSASPAQLRTQLLATADDLGEPDTDGLYSHGRLNARRALEEP
jgi:subtilisin family serine protease